MYLFRYLDIYISLFLLLDELIPEVTFVMSLKIKINKLLNVIINPQRELISVQKTGPESPVVAPTWLHVNTRYINSTKDTASGAYINCFVFRKGKQIH